MSKRQTDQTVHSWTISLTGMPAKFVGIVYDQPDEASAIKAATAVYKVPPNLQSGLIAERRDNLAGDRH